uniref:M-myrmeciitoxin-Mb3a n=1 Tax=Myrmecia banksi TaxID=36171 RepID=TX3A_MYRBA|nr:RecName: Full=M-myrmeciitoxin-Mb3a; Short=M-MIITX-Mb3a; AltName: Full=M-myrmeciitoxin-Mp4a; Short=M-MIITX-Mp4a; AltName: Full=Myrb5; AltName: Full=Pilosulin-5; Flags: Precursor [Myrmecia banksi]BAF95069.1 pilosulin 5 [Myrmecia banksi]
MKLSCLSLALAIILILAIVHSPNMEVKALADPEADAFGEANAFGEADAFAEANADVKGMKKAIKEILDCVIEKGYDKLAAKLKKVIQQLWE